MIRPIVAYGNPILNQPSSKVDIENEDISNVIDDMWETMNNANGVGLAAPQIGKAIRLFIIDTSPFGYALSIIDTVIFLSLTYFITIG
mgnify:CR=1 FL=1